MRCHVRDLEQYWAPFQLAPMLEQAVERRTLEATGERKLSGGLVRHLKISMTPLVDQDGEMLGVSFVFEDRTPLVRLRADVAATVERLDGASAKLLANL